MSKGMGGGVRGGVGLGESGCRGMKWNDDSLKKFSGKCLCLAVERAADFGIAC